MSGEDRQPRATRHDLQGLLKFCLEATQSEDAPAIDENVVQNMNPERREWLQQAINGMSVDVIKELTESAKILSDEKVDDPEADVEDVEYAFGCISDWVGQIDMANNFHKIGGFEALRLCLRSPHASLRSGAANIFAELSQNNPYCQSRVSAEGFIPMLTELLDTDKDNTVRVKALYAISSITRDFPVAQEQFDALDGHSVILRAMQSDHLRLRIKACFYVASLCQRDPEAKKAFAEMGLVSQLTALLQSEHDQSHEHIANALLIMVKDNPSAQDEARQPALGLGGFLRDRLKMLNGKEEFEEERTYCQSILDSCFNSNQMPVDR